MIVLDRPLYKIENFEGPLDLLLFLISKHKFSINDVPILELVGQYIEYVRMMQDENMEIASEFLEMAARLVYIKTVSLLPVHDEADKLTGELRGELSEYQDCQIMAGKLAKQANGFDMMTKSPEKIEADMTYTRTHPPETLLKAYLSAVGKRMRRLPPPVEAFSGIVAKKIVSVGSRIQFIIGRMIFGKKYSVVNLFETSASRSEMVATFLAILSLIKERKIYLDGAGEGASIELLGDGEAI